MGIADMATALSKTPMPQTHGNGNAFLWSTDVDNVCTKYQTQLPPPECLEPETASYRDLS